MRIADSWVTIRPDGASLGRTGTALAYGVQTDLERLAGRVRGLIRRRAWIQHRPTLGALRIALGNALALAMGREVAAELPSLLKVDISPVCSLACPHCLHADPTGRNLPALSAQRFSAEQRMSVEAFGKLMDAVSGRVMAVSLYYYGDPLSHPDLDAIIRRARQADMSVHITSHMSYVLSDARIRSLVESGLSHLTVAIDGATQASYAQTRVRGRLDRVLHNLERIVACRSSLGRRLPVVEVQHLRFQHHAADEEQRVRALADAVGADRFTAYDGLRHDPDGSLYNVVKDLPDEGTALEPRGYRGTPHCSLPYSSSLVRYDGAVIPCCLWRAGAQYAPGADARSVGNVFDTSLEEIWNGAAYRAIRRQVLKPAAKAGTFCDGCPKLVQRPGQARPHPEQAFRD